MNWYNCDDGNNDNGDGCNSVCDYEPGFICFDTPGKPTFCYKISEPNIIKYWITSDNS